MALAWFAGAWIAGVAGASELRFPSWQFLILSSVALAAAYGVRQDRRLARFFLAVTFLFLGATRAQIAEQKQAAASVVAYIGRAGSVDLKGVVSSTPTRRGEAQLFDLRSQQVRPVDGSPGAPVDGAVLVILDPAAAVRRGETILARGRLRVPQGMERPAHSAVFEASSLQTLAYPGNSPLALLDAARARIVERLYSVLPAGEASLVAGVLLGADENMPEPVRTAFRTTGTAHILAVSGFNVTIVAAASMAAFAGLLGARRGAAAAGVAILLYTLLAGADPPVVRAAIMAGTVLLAARLGRQSSALAALAAAAIAMTFLDPSTVKEVGFQLSFLATLGLVVAARPLQGALREWSEGAIGHDGMRATVMLVGEVVLITFIAQVATLPLSAYVFHQLPVTSLLANALILPAQPPLMATGALAALASLLDISVGRAAAWLAWPFAAYTIRVADLFAGLPGASLHLPTFPSGYLALIYAGLAGIVLAARAPKFRVAARGAARLGGPVWLILLAALTTLAWKAALERPDGRLHVTALSGGDVLIESPAGRFVALKRAPGEFGLAQGLDQHLPVTHPALDWLILSQTESAPETAMLALGRHAPPSILLLQETRGAAEDDRVAGTDIVQALAGSALDLGGGARLQILEPGRAGVTILISVGSSKILLTDLDDPSSLSSLARHLPRPAAVVLLGEGRPMRRIIESDWTAWAPRVIVACPIPGEAWPIVREAVGRPTLLATPLHGWVELTTDGETLEVRTERKP